MNRSIREQSLIGRFVAALLLCFDAFNRSVEVWNGAIPVAIYHDLDGRPVRRFPPVNLHLGLDDGERPPQTVLFQWHQEGAFFACTDGLVEAQLDGSALGGLEALLANVSPVGRLQAVRDRLETTFLRSPQRRPQLRVGGDEQAAPCSLRGGRASAGQPRNIL